MAYDPVRDRSLLVGGTGPSGLLVNSYEFDHATSTWSALTISGTRPAPRTLASIVFDPSRDVFFLFGGLDAAGAPLADTWEYDPKRALNVRWRSIAATGPAARSQAGFVFDSVRNVALLHGGRVSGGNTGDLWSFNGTNWTLVSSDGPLARSGHAAVALAGGSFLMVTGDCYSIANACSTETWTWRGPVASGDLAVGAVTGGGFGVNLATIAVGPEVVGVPRIAGQSDSLGAAREFEIEVVHVLNVLKSVGLYLVSGAKNFDRILAGEVAKGVDGVHANFADRANP
jgi:hypothetical protein